MRNWYHFTIELMKALFFAFLTTSSLPLHAEKPNTLPWADIDRLVIDALSHQGATKPKIISHIDLSKPFEASTQWTFVAIQDNGELADDMEEHGPIFLCLVKAARPDCSQHFSKGASGEMLWEGTPYRLFASSIVYVDQNRLNPLLLLQACGPQSGNGNCEMVTALYAYKKNNDRFIRVFSNLTGRNNNEATRFMKSGPLQGDVVVDHPTEDKPYNYWIEIYRPDASGLYGKVLRYRSHTVYSDGNPLSVADSEMPEILRRFGLWQTGDPLPVPPRMPRGCKTLFMRRGEEWCK